MARANQAKKPATTTLKWYQKPRWAVLLVPVCLVGAYAMASLAINSGSLIQYSVAIALVVLAVNRLIHVVLWGMGKARLG